MTRGGGQRPAGSPLPTAACLAAAIVLALLPRATAVQAQAPGAPPPAATAEAQPAAPADKFALQVAINDYLYAPPLYGCVEDAADMRQVLIERFGFKPENIDTLINAAATREAILAAFRRDLIENAKKHPGALVLFEYSGHGSQVPDLNHDEPDGKDETLVPVNGRDPWDKNFDILDDELGALFEELARYTPNVVFILDACNSGSATRALEVTREIPMDTRPQPPQPPLARTRGEPTRDAPGTDLLPTNQRYVTLSGCQPFERSHEVERGGRLHGVLTFNLVQALRRARPETSYRELMVEVSNGVATTHPDQHPQIEGDIRRFVFAGAADRKDPFIPVAAVDGPRVTLKAGAAQGVRAGTFVAFYAPDARRLVGDDKKLASGTVVEVRPLSATVEVPAGAVIPLDAQAVLVAPNFGSDRLRAALPPVTRGARAGDAALDSLRSLCAASNLVEAVEGAATRSAASVGGAAFDLAVCTGAFGKVFADTNALSPLAPGQHRPARDARVCYLAGRDSLPRFGFYAEVGAPEAAGRLAEALEGAARQRNLKALENASSPLNGGVKLSVVRVPLVRDASGQLAEGTPSPVPADRIDYAFAVGETFKLEIENASGSDLYTTLFDIAPDGSVQIMFPPEGDAGLLRKGAKVVTSGVYATSTPTGYETFKVIATSQPAEFHHLTQSAIRSATRALPGRSPLEQLMGQAMGHTRATPVGVAQPETWTTAQINFSVGAARP